MVLQVLVGVALGVLQMLMGGGPPSGSQMAGAIAVGNVITFAAVICFGVWRSKLPWPDVVPLTRFRPLVLAPLLPAVGGLWILGSEGENVVRGLGLEPESFREFTRQIGEGGAWSVIALVVVAPATEELLFRGVILTGLLRRYRTAPAVVCSAILFAVVHLNPCQLPAGFATGLFLGWLFSRTRSLWPCIAMHAIFNAQMALLPVLRDRWQIHIPGFIGGGPAGVVEFQPAWLDATGVALLLLGIWGVMRLTRLTRPAA